MSLSMRSSGTSPARHWEKRLGTASMPRGSRTRTLRATILLTGKIMTRYGGCCDIRSNDWVCVPVRPTIRSIGTSHECGAGTKTLSRRCARAPQAPDQRGFLGTPDTACDAERTHGFPAKCESARTSPPRRSGRSRIPAAAAEGRAMSECAVIRAVPTPAQAAGEPAAGDDGPPIARRGPTVSRQ